MSSTNVLVVGIFYDLQLIQVPAIQPIKNIDDVEEYTSVVKNMYFEFIASDFFKKFLYRDIIISYGDVHEEMVVERSHSVKWCGIYDHYSLVFSLNFHRPYIWADSSMSKKELTNWAYVTKSNNSDDCDDNNEYVNIKQYINTYEKMIKTSTKESNINYENTLLLHTK